MIKEFQGEYRWLSNFWPIGNVEKQYQAAKFLDNATVFITGLDGKPVKVRISTMILMAKTPGDAKRLAKKYKAYMRKDWETVNISIMLELVRKKFQIPELKAKLLATGDQLLQEGNKWSDSFWGVDLKTGKGKNWLGVILMRVREELKETA